jgi:hypothetical protein
VRAAGTHSVRFLLTRRGLEMMGAGGDGTATGPQRPARYLN